MIRILLLIFFTGCASAPSKLPTAAEVTSRKFSSSKEAGNYIRNKHTYLRMLFEQSRDPYYGTPKWTEECLAANKSGKVESKNGHTFFFTKLLLDAKKEPGNCGGSPRDVIYLHCENDSVAYEIFCPPGTCGGYLEGNPCPLRQ